MISCRSSGLPKRVLLIGGVHHLQIHLGMLRGYLLYRSPLLKKRGKDCLVTKAGKDSNTSPPSYPLPFHILEEEKFFILVQKERPSWVVTNEVGKEIAIRYYLKDSRQEIAQYLRSRFKTSENVDKDIQEFIQNLQRTGFAGEARSSESPELLNRFKGILFLVTQACNISCHHCSLGDIASVSRKISKEVFCRIVDESTARGGTSVLISGGEPLVRPDIFDLIQYAAQSQRVSLLTNGTLIGKEEAQKLKQAGVAEIVLSLDGASPEAHDQLRGKGNFRRVMRGIEFLREEGLEERINLNYCLTKFNIGEALDFLRFVEEIGLKKVSFLPVKKVGRASGSWEDLRPKREAYEDFILALYDMFFAPDFSLRVNIPLSGFHPVIRPGERVSTCPFGTQLIVNGEGDIYTCPALFIPDFRLGNVSNTSISKALNSMKLVGLREKYRARLEKIARCRSCVWRVFCQGGCTSTVYLEKGTFWDTDDFCEFRDRLYRRAILTAAERKAGKEGMHAGICSV